MKWIYALWNGWIFLASNAGGNTYEQRYHGVVAPIDHQSSRFTSYCGTNCSNSNMFCCCIRDHVASYFSDHMASHAVVKKTHKKNR